MKNRCLTATGRETLVPQRHIRNFADYANGAERRMLRLGHQYSIAFLLLLLWTCEFGTPARAQISLGNPVTYTASSIGAAAPQGLTYHPTRNSIFVLDTNSKMIEIDLSGNVLQSFDLGLRAPGGGVSYDPVTGDLLVTNDLKVFRVAVNGSTVTELVDLDGDVFASEGITVHPQTGDIWIADDNNEEIVRVTRSGVFVNSFSTRDLNPAFTEPTGLTLLDGDLLISDDQEGTRSLYLVSPNGQLLQDIGDMSVFGVNDPEGVTAVGDSEIWICGDADNKIVMLRRLDSVNQAPTANAGATQTKTEGSLVNLDGSGSSDPDSDALTYSWLQIDGPTVSLSGAQSVSASFTAPDVDATTTLIFRLTVSDGQLQDEDTTSVVVQNSNQPPTADAGPAQTKDEGSLVTLDGSGSSDPDSDPLTFSWQQTGGPQIDVSDPDEAVITFTAPNVGASTTLTFQLTVSDGDEQDTDVTTVSVENVQVVNRAPSVELGPDRFVRPGQIVTLDANVFDPDGDTLSFLWSQTGGPAVTLSSANTRTTSFVAPAVQNTADLTFRFRASDGVDSTVESLTVTVSPSATSFYFPQVADGVVQNLRFQSSLILVSKGTEVNAQVEFFDSTGQPMELELGDLGTASSFSVDLGAGEAVSLQTPGTAAGIRVGYARVTADAELGGTVVFTRSDAPSGTILYEAGVPAAQTWQEFRLFVDSTGVRDTGLALVYPESEGGGAQADATVTLSLYDTGYNLVDEEIVRLEPGDHLPRYVFQLFPQVAVAGEMEGVLVVSSDQPLAAITLRQNDAPGLDYPDEVPVLTTFPVIP